MMQQWVLAILFFVLPNISVADVTETGKITSILVEGKTSLSVVLDGVDNITECSKGGRWTASTVDDPLFKEKLASLLAAASSGKTVTLQHITAWGCGNWDSNKIYYVKVSY